MPASQRRKTGLSSPYRSFRYDLRTHGNQSDDYCVRWLRTFRSHTHSLACMYEIHTRSMGGRVRLCLIWACVRRRTTRYGYSAPSIVMENISKTSRKDVDFSLSRSQVTPSEPLFMYDTSCHVVGRVSAHQTLLIS